MKTYSTQPGHRFPFGATFDFQGTNFSVWGRFATRVELLLFEKSDNQAPFQIIELDPEVNKTFFAWHVYVEELSPATFYGWCMDGPGDTRSTGHRFNKEKLLIDPWARAVTHESWDFMALLLLSQGVPMILSGDEVLRTQQGNNNGYCQDNDLSWFDWTLTEKHGEMLRFVAKMIGFRKRHPCLMRKHFLTGKKKEKSLEVIAPTVRSGERVLIAAHGNSLRALVKYLDNIPDDVIPEVNIPTGMPLVYELSDDLRPIRNYYLGDPEKVKKAMEAVASQAKVSRDPALEMPALE